MDALPIGEESVRGYEPESPETADAWSGGWPQTPGEFEVLVNAFLDRLVRFAHRRMNDLQDAEDVVQEVFIRAFAERAKFRKVEKPGPYLYRMVGNACTDSLRKRKANVVPIEEVGDTIEAGDASPVEAAVAAEGVRRAEELLATLPADQAEAIRLRVFDELRLHEIADILDCSIHTVSSRLRYGFRKLRTIVARKRGIRQ